MKLFLVWIFIAVLFSAMATELLNKKSIFFINDIIIDLNVRSEERLAWSDEMTKVRASLKVFRGQPIWKISVDEVRRVIDQYTHLEKIQIQKKWPHSLEVSFTLPDLKVIYPISENKFQILTDKGKWLGPVRWSSLPSLPWVKGSWITRIPDLQTKVIELIDHLPTKGLLTSELVSEIQYNDIDGFLISLIKSSQQIRFGMEGFELKSLRVNQVLEYLQAKGLESRVIDLNFSKKVLVRLRNQP